MKQTVFVVLWNNYGDQGVDFLGTFSSREKAKALTEVHVNIIAKQYSRELTERDREAELSYYSIVESEVI